MNMTRKIGYCIAFFLISCMSISAQDSIQVTLIKKLNLQQVVELAREQSLAAILAKHRFRSSYWSNRSFKANYLPSLNFTSQAMPTVTKAYDKVVDTNTGKDEYVPRQSMNLSGGFDVTQNIGLTGGKIYLKTDLEQTRQIGEKNSSSFVSTPVSIGITQPLFAYNSLYWDKKIKPLDYEKAKLDYISQMESVNNQAVRYFFQLALAQLNLQVCETNFANNDTIYQLSQGRYQIGTIAENELLQIELNQMNAKTKLNTAKNELQSKKFQLRSFLNYKEGVDFELIVDGNVPSLQVDYQEVLEYALKNSPDILSYKTQLLEAQRTVAQAKGDVGFRGTLTASFGLTQRADNITDAYNNPIEQQRVNLQLNVPIVDWGLGRGRLQMAESNRQVVETQVSQSEIEFEQDVFLQVMQFNSQADQVAIAAKADTVGMRSYEVTKQRYMIGKVSVTDLNIADSDKDQARQGYITALQNYWTYFYTLRQLALFDFVNKKPLTQNYDELLEN